MKKHLNTVVDAFVTTSMPVCEHLEQSLSVLDDHCKAQSRAVDRLDRKTTGFLIVLGCVAALALAGLCTLLFLVV